MAQFKAHSVLPGFILALQHTNCQTAVARQGRLTANLPRKHTKNHPGNRFPDSPLAKPLRSDSGAICDTPAASLVFIGFNDYSCRQKL